MRSRRRRLQRTRSPPLLRRVRLNVACASSVLRASSRASCTRECCPNAAIPCAADVCANSCAVAKCGTLSPVCLAAAVAVLWLWLGITLTGSVVWCVVCSCPFDRIESAVANGVDSDLPPNRLLMEHIQCSASGAGAAAAVASADSKAGNPAFTFFLRFFSASLCARSLQQLQCQSHVRLPFGRMRREAVRRMFSESASTHGPFRFGQTSQGLSVACLSFVPHILVRCFWPLDQAHAHRMICSEHEQQPMGLFCSVCQVSAALTSLQ
jgi:hypothetical protein